MLPLTQYEYETRFCDQSKPIDAAFRLALTEKEDCLMPARRLTIHKYNCGRALILAGSEGYPGAPVLAANACERSGAGLTTLMVPRTIYEIAAIKCSGAVVTPLPASADGTSAPEALEKILPALEKADACVIGPGFGTGEASRQIVHSVLIHARCPLVLDADALTLCARETDFLSSCRSQLVLTPHEGEFRRLGGSTEDGRLAGAAAFLHAHPELILILKGYGTLVCHGNEIAVNPTGNPAMAKGGSGDVLCGILCALLAQKKEPYTAAKKAVYLHGLAGDLAKEEFGEYSVTPSDLIDLLPQAFKAVSASG